MEQLQQEEESHVQMLPEEVLADVLRRLAPRSLAVSRGVCKAWLAAIDDHRLLRPELLPRSLGGMFIDFNIGCPKFFTRCSGGGAATAPTVGDLAYTSRPNRRVEDHCNGLLLRFQDVVNPATRRWAPLPRPPPPRPRHMSKDQGFFAQQCLVYDPAVSPHHYEVFLMPFIAWWARLDDDAATARSEWPPSPCETHVFSSRTGRWDERSFVREGEPAGTVADAKRAAKTDKRYSVYWRGALYVHSQNDFICRVSLEDSKYQVIKSPTENEPAEEHDYPDPYLGRSEKGVYCAILDRDFRRLRVWILDESSSSAGGVQMEWVLRHQCNSIHRVLFASRDSYQRDDGARWCFQDRHHYTNYPEADHHRCAKTQQYCSGGELKPVDDHHPYIAFLGLHPFKEIVYLGDMRSALAYDLNTSKVQYLGCIAGAEHEFIKTSFPYTPCGMDINSLRSST